MQRLVIEEMDERVILATRDFDIVGSCNETDLFAELLFPTHKFGYLTIQSQPCRLPCDHVREHDKVHSPFKPGMPVQCLEPVKPYPVHDEDMIQLGDQRLRQLFKG